ncbi:hypothetical protein V1T75_15775 [Tenacibaculum sp. FZY0031]|uniref:hypothetical protein n=1 Tax=unclassified Tenacibaculum TaxID=2635139 RepID=UPI002EA427DB|nr:hypothetical protein [Tenacibaculum sp. FZY0031]
MKTINDYISDFKSLGFVVENLNNKSVLFSKDNLKFKVKVKLTGYLEVYEINGNEDKEDLMNRLDIFIKLREKEFINNDTFIHFVDNNITNSNHAKVIKMLFSDENEKIKFNISNKKKPFINKFKYLLVIIPKSSRAEFISDLQCIISDMKTDNCSKLYITFIVLLHIASVVYHAFFFKLKGYFYPNKEQSNKD